MRIPAVAIGHPAVETIQPTWHCLKRFRERHGPRPGTDAALAELDAALREAEITTRPPRGVSARGDWTLWAVNGDLAFPLVDEGGGRFTAPTCLTAAG